MALKLKAGGSLLSVSATTGKLSCECCCTPDCPTPTIQWKSRSASKTKTGNPEFAGYVSTPPKRYLKDTWSGIQESKSYASSPCSGAVTSKSRYEWYGISTYDYSGGCTTTKTQDRYDLSGLVSSTGPYDCNVTMVTVGGGIPSSGILAGETVAYSCSGFSSFEKNSLSTLSSEYTTATLKSNTTAALSAYTGTWTGTAGSYFNLTTNELTNSIRQAKYRFQFTVPETCGAEMCYKI